MSMGKFVLRTKSYRVDEDKGLWEERVQCLVGGDRLRLCDLAVRRDPRVAGLLRNVIERREHGPEDWWMESQPDGWYAFVAIGEVTGELP